MNSHEAKAILLRYRADRASDFDAEIAAALEQVRHDPELERWFEQHCRFQSQVAQAFRTIAVPEQLRERIVTSEKTIQLPATRRYQSWWAAAAVVFILLGLASGWFGDSGQKVFSQFKLRMVQTALREYRMDVVTNDDAEIRRFLASELKTTGAALLRWRNNPVSMVCFDRGDSQMVFLFVINAEAADGPPAGALQTGQVNKLMTASWTEANRVYLLAGFDEPAFPQKYLGSLTPN
jgi:hypothetical protein